MRLVKAEVRGFGRLAEGKINLDNKVIAIVGPNEAGKTTLLRALAFVSNKATLSAAERSRLISVPDDTTVVRVQYLLDEEDKQSVSAFELEESPQSLWISRTAAGDPNPHFFVEPAPEKAVAPLESLLKSLRVATTKKALGQLNFTVSEPDENGNIAAASDLNSSLREDVESVLQDFFEHIETDGPAAATTGCVENLRTILNFMTENGLTGLLVEAVSAVIGWADREDPTSAVAQALYERTPKILLFSEEDRTLTSVHELSDVLVVKPPASLANLASMADLDLAKLWETFTTGDEGERETLIDEANRTLATKFESIWKQSNITVVFKTEQKVLTIRIKQDGKRITQFDERSSGLKMFVALAAFLATREEDNPPVLLIDEAETHLHIDAQADLVNTFMSQKQAAKIIYTTHSPACLPPDLGSNIRSVVPDPNHEFRSLIQGSFWNGTVGFSPLMLAMGAGAAAFSTARFVVLGEGASEMLMLPTMIKRAINAADLEYQVAPGLSEVPPAMYPELDLAGARVAFLVDGDKGGQDRRVALIAGGIPEDRIVTLGALTLENLLDDESYLRVVTTLLNECNLGAKVPELPSLPDAEALNWPSFLEQWAHQRSLKMPGKRVVASRLVEDQMAIPSPYGTQILRALHVQLDDVLHLHSNIGSN